MRFTACIQYNPPSQKSKWLLCHDNILCVTPQNHPLLSCTILTDITEIKKDSALYYSIHDGDHLLLQKSLGQESADFTLTDRELEIVELLGKGKTTKEIADDLFISFETVKKHRSNILTKTKCNNTAELINALSFMGFV
ncbi:MAG: LuxR C-terminal-related transcriptional regulator [Cytophagales bacterium]|nr:LuxR C-terminal-related transcriptional regulator [Cytophagales bacterium]